jgi:hypothetical protein
MPENYETIKKKEGKVSKEEIREDIASSTNYAELYQNSLNVLQKMEDRFRRTLDDEGIRMPD